MSEQLDFIGKWKTRDNTIVEIVGSVEDRWFGFIGGGLSRQAWWNKDGNHPVKKELDLIERISGFANPEGRKNA